MPKPKGSLTTSTSIFVFIIANNRKWFLGITLKILSLRGAYLQREKKSFQNAGFETLAQIYNVVSEVVPFEGLQMGSVL